MFAGKLLKDDETLSDYNIQDRALVQVLPQDPRPNKEPKRAPRYESGLEVATVNWVGYDASLPQSSS